jgi:hypothetical protein
MRSNSHRPCNLFSAIGVSQFLKTSAGRGEKVPYLEPKTINKEVKNMTNQRVMILNFSDFAI